MRTSEFVYSLPESAIAQSPVEPRHAARLLDTRDLTDHRFLELPELLRSGDLVVVNDTRVRAARLIGQKSTGGEVEVLLLRRLTDERWTALVRPARRIRVGTRIEFEGLRGRVATDPVEGLATVELAPTAGEEVESAVARVGTVPLPPYVKVTLDDPDRYQTMFARLPGSAAAPTAGLHFTPVVVERLQAHGIQLAAVSLEVGIDTFRPISGPSLSDHRMHSERYDVPEATVTAIRATRDRGGRVVAIGTTVVRTLEAAAVAGRPAAGPGTTDLFIVPGFGFRVVDALVTNLHLPGSTLVVLVAAFLGPAWRRIYAHALARGYRFLSFGDAMFGERAV